MAVYLMIPCWAKEKEAAHWNAEETMEVLSRGRQGASGLGGIEAGTKEVRWLMESRQRRGKKG